MTIRPRGDDPLPPIVLATRDAVLAEARALDEALDRISHNPQPGCPAEADRTFWPEGTGPKSLAQAHLAAWTRLQAQLVCTNAYDHLTALGRALGSDGAMSLYAHASLSRVVCEAAVRLSWLLESDPTVTSAERIVRGAVALLVSADEQLRGLNSIPVGRLDPSILQVMVDNCVRERYAIHSLITDAGLTMKTGKDGKTIARIELARSVTSVPLRLNISTLMNLRLPDSPTWYNLSSGITHSYFWMLCDAVTSPPAAELVLEPNLMQAAAAGQCAISASRLIIETIAAYHGHDPQRVGAPSAARRASARPVHGTPGQPVDSHSDAFRLPSPGVPHAVL